MNTDRRNCKRSQENGCKNPSSEWVVHRVLRSGGSETIGVSEETFGTDGKGVEPGVEENEEFSFFAFPRSVRYACAYATSDRDAVKSTPITKKRNPAIVMRPSMKRKPNNFMRFPLVILQLSRRDASGPERISSMTNGKKMKATAAIIPGTIKRTRPARIARKVTMEARINGKNRRHLCNARSSEGEV